MNALSKEIEHMYK